MTRSARIAQAGLLLLALFVLWWPRWPPLGDLPQHAAQVTWLLRLGSDDPGHLADLFRLNYATPYLLGYVLAWIFAQFLGVTAALKLVLTLYVVGLVAGVEALLAQVQARREWALLAIPVALGLPYQWGLFNFLVGLPLLLAAVLFSIRFIKRPTGLGGMGIALVLAVLVPVHALIGLVAGAIGGVMALTHPNPLSRRALVAIPFTAPLPAVVAWATATASAEPMTHLPTVWDNILLRPGLLPMFLLSAVGSVPAVIAGLIILVLPFLLGARPSTHLWRWAPLALLIVLLAITPSRVFGTVLIWERLTPLAFVFWLFALEPRRSVLRGAWVTPAFVLVPALWLMGQAAAVVAWEYESTDLLDVMADIPPDQRVLSLAFDREGAAPQIAYVHQSSWYVTEKGGLVELSFAQYFPQMVRYAPGTAPQFPPGFDFKPAVFDYNAMDGERWEWFIVRSLEDRADQIFAGAPTQHTLIRQEGAWRLYRRAP